jgi:AraC-like DNA-binding protein
MNVKVKLSETGNWLHQQPATNTDATDETRLDFPDKNYFISRQTRAGGFLFSDLQGQLQEPIQLVYSSEEDLIQLHFLLRGGTWQEWGGEGTIRPLTEGQHTIGYHSLTEATIGVTPQAGIVDCFMVYVARELYFQLVPPTSTLHSGFAQCIKEKQFAYIADQNLPITPAMNRLIDAIRQCQRESELKQLYIQAKLVELLMLQLEQHQQLTLSDGKSLLPDQQKVQEARTILESRFADPPTISELARLVGLNEFKLKKGFKRLVGCPIYRYVVRLRMEQARHWLLEGDQSIGEVAHYVGYKNHAHFTAAYKQYYNSLPSELSSRTSC